MTAAETAAICALARERGMRVHLDGARVFNAAVALETEAHALAREADSAMFSLTKGLSAPVGSVLVSGRDFIDRARRMRALVGGAMRQAGVIAAAGLVALDMMVGRLVEDHRHARLLAEGLRGVAGMRLDLDAVQTNIVMVEVADAQTVQKGLTARGVLCNTVSPRQLRFVTHRHIQTADLDRVVDAVRGLHLAAVGR